MIKKLYVITVLVLILATLYSCKNSSNNTEKLEKQIPQKSIETITESKDTKSIEVAVEPKEKKPWEDKHYVGNSDSDKEYPEWIIEDPWSNYD